MGYKMPFGQSSHQPVFDKFKKIEFFIDSIFFRRFTFFHSNDSCQWELLNNKQKNRI